MTAGVETRAEFHQAARTRGAIVDRPRRGLIEVRGTDRAAWLHNLVTNAVKTLGAGEGNYAFAVNVKGRTLFDLNILMMDDPADRGGRVWLDLDAGRVDGALRHLNRYVISEDVQLADRGASVGRLGVLGPRAGDLAARLGWGGFGPMAQLQHVTQGSGDGAVTMVRHDFAGLPGAEFIVGGAARDALRGKMLEAGREPGLGLIDEETLDVLRLEAGIPDSVRDIDEDVVPPETLQIERGISYHKGCYLGQEVIERMRSHGVLARRLVGLRLSGADAPAPPLTLVLDGQEVGRVTSACWSFALGAPLGLGYVRSAHAAEGTRLTAQRAGAAPIEAEIVPLPVRG